MSKKIVPDQIHGRCTAKEGSRLCLLNQTGSFWVPVDNPKDCQIGALLSIEGGHAQVLTPNRSPDGASPLATRILDPRRLHGLKIRSQTELAIRDFFSLAGFDEVRTPLLVPCPGMEPHIRPFKVSGALPPLFLPTSPEFAMKRLLVGGLERIFQMNSAFRDEPPSITHLPEFTMLEWYRAYSDIEQVMRDTENLFSHLAEAVLSSDHLNYQGQRISIRPPWPRLRVRDLFREMVGIDLVKSSTRDGLAGDARRLKLDISHTETWDDIYFKIWLNLIEPALPRDQAVFITDYPPSQAALSVIKTHEDGTPWARRFEAYAGGLELCNAFEELTDPKEQRRRFEKDMALRKSIYGTEFPQTPIDEGFLAALAEGMPPSSGNALGVDRLIMLLADETDIRYTVWLS